MGSVKPLTSSVDVTGVCHRISVKELPSITSASVIKASENDFLDTNPREGNVSQEDIQVLQLLNGEIHHNKEGHLEMSLLFSEHPQLPEKQAVGYSSPEAFKRGNREKSQVQRGLCEIYGQCL